MFHNITYLYKLYQQESYNNIHKEFNMYTNAMKMPVHSLCRGWGFYEPASEPWFYAMPASKLKKISAGSGPASKTKSPHRLTEPHTNNFMFHAVQISLSFIIPTLIRFLTCNMESIQFMTFTCHCYIQVQHILLSLYAVYSKINTIHVSLVSTQYLFVLLF